MSIVQHQAERPRYSLIAVLKGLSIICTDENPEEPIVKVGENLWCMYINAEKDIEEDGFSYRNFLIYSPSSVECTITTPTIKPNSILYYSIRPKLEVKLSNEHNKVDRQVGNGKATIIFDCKMKDLSIVCVDGEIEETVNKSSDRLRFVHIDVSKDLKVKSSCSRPFIAKRGDISILLINTGFINPNQVLYYTVIESNKLEAQLLDISVTD